MDNPKGNKTNKHPVNGITGHYLLNIIITITLKVVFGIEHFGQSPRWFIAPGQSTILTCPKMHFVQTDDEHGRWWTNEERIG